MAQPRTEPARLAPAELARLIDHSVLRPEVTRAEVLQACADAAAYGFAALFVAPCWIALAAERLEGSAVKAGTTVGFPHGNTSTAAKACEAEKALESGARELDMVMNVGFLKSGERARVVEDIRAVVAAARLHGALVKVILETALLTGEEKAAACGLAEEAGADFVKTSTGYAAKGASPEDVALLRRAVGDRLGVKAAGGIADLATVEAMLRAGASRIGSSRSLAIMRECAERQGK